MRVKDIERLKMVLNDLKVLARANFDDKCLLVNGLQDLGKDVSVVGDDLLARSNADVSFAMGKDVAHIMLLDENFNSIINALYWGRNI